MTAPAVDDVRQALATQLSTIDGLHGYGYSPTVLDVPCAVVSLPSIPEDMSFQSGLEVHSYTVTVYVGQGDIKTSEVRLAGYLSATGTYSVKACLNTKGPNALVTGVNEIRVASRRALSPAEMGEEPYLAAEFQVDVYQSGA